MAVGALALPAAAAAQQLVYVVLMPSAPMGGPRALRWVRPLRITTPFRRSSRRSADRQSRIADDEYDKLFVVVPGTGTMTAIRY